MINQCVLEKHVTWPTVAKGLFPCFCHVFDVQLSSVSRCAELFCRAAKRFSDFFFLICFYVCFLPLFSGVFLNVIRYSKRIRNLLLVLFCRLT